MLRFLICFGLFLGLSQAGHCLGEEQDLPGYRTVTTAITTQVKRQTSAGGAVQPGYLGVFVEADPEGHVVVADVAPESPAAKAGVTAGDVVSHLGE